MKLVRDYIPDIIRANGETPIVRRVTGKKLIRMLVQKVLEEAMELSQAQTVAALAEELADVMEVVDTLWRAVGSQRVDRVRAAKQLSHGAFADGIVLLGTKPAPKKRKRR